MLPRMLAIVLQPLGHLLQRLVPIEDPWERLSVQVPLQRFGSGARHDVSWFLEGETAASTGTLDEMMAWLDECEYASDTELFAEADFWQHPRTFETLRKGDCEDFALWAWRRLLELGVDAELVVGWAIAPDQDPGRHAWVHFTRDGTEYLYEPTRGKRATAVRPLAEVRDEYVPEFGVGSDGRRFAFGGFLYMKQHPELRKRRKRVRE